MTQIERIKYLKLVNRIEKNREEWAYKDITLNEEFELHWQSSSGKVTNRHKANANKARKGDLILLFQNHQRFGHRMTHIVELVNIDRPDLSKAEALRRAQLEFLKDDSLSRPYFWASYVLLGNWL